MKKNLDFEQFKVTDKNIHNIDDLTFYNSGDILGKLQDYCLNNGINFARFCEDNGNFYDKQQAIDFVTSECDFNNVMDPSISDLALIDYGKIGNNTNKTMFLLDGGDRVHVAKVGDYNAFVDELEDDYKDYLI